METDQTPYGKLYLIPTLLGDNEPLVVLPLTVKQTVEQLSHFIVENERSARRFIKKITPRKSQDSLKIYPLNKYTEPAAIPQYLEPCLQGVPMGLLSEAGCPAIADPGSEIVSLAHDKGIQVVPLVGPSSILLALMASGLNGQNFSFNGYLPIDPAERRRALKALEKRSAELGQSQFFMETPYRNEKLVEDLLRTLRGDTRLCIAADLTLGSEFVKTCRVADWKGHLPELNKRPAIFGIHAA
ncbi:SAM-dependent methyltransferase [Robiginitalea sp. SC105]|uniref:SAM-dependent methyltransferase n=1 Tax=Robiginitalea sp. SC105 TaxID=2762332 RepID=UPI00163AEF4D|nr:SAM-dependent methyltransferase [Robiginitalea sp. SC105]MBC2840787.1 SAM-dependent methyltransferase [Robiginitalea sp. SC105]